MTDPIQQMSDGAKHAADVVASIGTVTVAISHVAAMLTPILTFLIALMTLAWWCVRLWDRFKPKPSKD